MPGSAFSNKWNMRPKPVTTPSKANGRIWEVPTMPIQCRKVLDISYVSVGIPHYQSSASIVEPEFGTTMEIQINFDFGLSSGTSQKASRLIGRVKRCKTGCR